MREGQSASDSPDKGIEERVSLHLSWTRPANVPYPNIWQRLELKSKKTDGRIYHVRIEDVTPDRYEEVSDFMVSNFDCQEPISRSINMSADEEFMAERRVIRRKVLQQKVALIATLEDDPNLKIIGALLLVVNSKNDGPLKVVGEKWKILRNFFSDILKKGIDPFQHLNSDCYFSDYGVAVAPEYYGLGLGFHLFSCILPMGKAFDIPGAFTIFTSNFSQTIAEKLGFELCREVSYEEYKNENGSRVFPVEGTCKCMILKLQHRELP